MLHLAAATIRFPVTVLSRRGHISTSSGTPGGLGYWLSMLVHPIRTATDV